MTYTLTDRINKPPEAGPFDQRLGQRPDLWWFYQALGADQYFNQFLPGIIWVNEAVEICLDFYPCFDAPVVRQLQTFVAGGVEFVHASGFSAHVKAADEANIFSSVIKQYPVWSLLAQPTDSGRLSSEDAIRLKRVGAAFKIITVLSVLNFKGASRAGKKIAVGKQEITLKALIQAAHALRRSIVLTNDIYLSEVLGEVDQCFLTAHDIAEAIRSLRALETGSARSGNLPAEVHNALTKIDPCLPPSREMLIQKAIAVENKSYLMNFEGLGPLFVNQVGNQKNIENIVNVIPNFDATGVSKYELLGEEDTVYAGAECTSDADEDIKTEVHRRHYFSERCMGRLLRMQNFSPFSRELFNSVERRRLRKFLDQSIELSDEEKKAALFLALSIALSKNAEDLSKILLGEGGELINAKEYVREIPDIPNPAVCVAGTEDEFFDRSKRLILPLPEIVQALIKATGLNIFERLRLKKSDVIDTFHERGYTENIIQGYLIKGMQKLREQYGPRFNPKRVESQLQYYFVVRTRDLALTQTLFRKPAESLVVSGHYRHLPAKFVVEQYRKISNEYFMECTL